MSLQKAAGFFQFPTPRSNLTPHFCPFQAIRLSLEQALPPEPKEENAEPVSKLRIRTPSGEFLERRFLASSKLQIVFDFVASKGFPWDEFKLLSTFPRRDVSSHAYLGQCVQMGVACHQSWTKQSKKSPMAQLIKGHTLRSPSLFCTLFSPQPWEKYGSPGHRHVPSSLSKKLGTRSFFLAISTIPAFLQVFTRSHLYIPYNRPENCVLNNLTVRSGKMIIVMLQFCH